MPHWAKDEKFWKGTLAVLALVLATALTLAEGSPPPPHPDYAFDSALLAQVERGVVFFAIALGVSTVVFRGFRGLLPNFTTSGPQYDSDTALQEATARMDDLNGRVDGHDRFLANSIEPVVLALRTETDDLQNRVRRIEERIG